MAASYPGAIPSLTRVTDNVDFVKAAEQNEKADEIEAIATELGTDVAGSVADLKTRLAQSMDDSGNIDFATSTELTISSGSITPTQNWHTVDTEADTSIDDLETIVGMTDGFPLFLRPNNDARTIIIKHNVGNIVCIGNNDISLNDEHDIAVCVYDATLAKWIVGMLARADDGGWIADGNTWTQTGDHTFTISGNYTSVYRKGTKVRYKDSSGSYEYGVVASSSYSAPDTAVTLITNDDYLMVGTISEQGYSYAQFPEGFPATFNFDVTWSATTTNPTIGDGTLTAKWQPVSPGVLRYRVYIKFGSTTTAGSGTYSWDYPVNPAEEYEVGHLYILDSGTRRYAGMSAEENTSALRGLYLSSTAVPVLVGAAAPVTWAANDIILLEIEYTY